MVFFLIGLVGSSCGIVAEIIDNANPITKITRMDENIIFRILHLGTKQ
jgi:hypothetical protein